MHIELSTQQVALLRDFVNPIIAANVAAECEPPGFSVTVTFLGPYGTSAVGECGGRTIDLGDVSVLPEQHGWGLLS